MKLLLFFFFLCFVVGTIWDRKPTKQYVLPLLGLCSMVAIGYFFFNQS